MQETKSNSPQASCADEYDPESLSVQQAIERIYAMLRPIDSHEQLDIRSALNRVLGDDVTSTINVPSHTNSAMDNGLR